MNIAILGVCGTFMSGVARLAQQLGHQVWGYDQGIYPPMSTQLQQAGIEIVGGYQRDLWDTQIDQLIVGNGISRGNDLLELALERGTPYYSGPDWLRRHVLDHKRVIAVGGTHGKTTTTTMITWILIHAGMNPSYLIGGQPQQLRYCAHLSDTDIFVIEADEYDSAFCDKRSKFVHYKPDVFVINNLEFDHADIFNSLADIQNQFHQLIRTMPSSAHIICPENNEAIHATLNRGCWSKRIEMSQDRPGEGWWFRPVDVACQKFDIYRKENLIGQVNWSLAGCHNAQNALAAMAATQIVGVTNATALAALNRFQGVKRRLEYLGRHRDVEFYSDFAHHPTAIKLAIDTLRQLKPNKRLVILLELGTSTQRQASMLEEHQCALKSAHRVLLLQPQTDSLAVNWLALHTRLTLYATQDVMQETLMQSLSSDEVILIISSRALDRITHKMNLELDSTTQVVEV